MATVFYAQSKNQSIFNEIKLVQLLTAVLEMDYCGQDLLTDSKVKKVAILLRNESGIREKEGAREQSVADCCICCWPLLSLKCQGSRLLCRCIKVEDGAWEGLWECKAAQQTEGHPAGFKQTRLAILFSQKFNQSPWIPSLLMSYKCFS